MGQRRASLGREFGFLWGAHAVSSLGTGLAFGAFSIVAITVLEATAEQVSMLAGAGLVVGAVLAVPLGPWLETRAKRPVMVALGLIRFAVLASIPAAHLLGALTFAHLLLVSIVTAAAKIAFGAASGAYLRSIVRPDQLVAANSRFESVTWSTTVVGPPAGGVLIGLFGPVVTVAVDAVSYLLSALGIAAIATPEESATPCSRSRRWTDLFEGWRYILSVPSLRALLFNSLLVNGLIMAAEPPLAALMLGHLGFSAWEYGLAFAIPCIGGFLGARFAPAVVARFGECWALRVMGTLRACWPLGLAFVQPGWIGLATVVVTETGLIVCCALFNPVLAAHRLKRTDPALQARVLTAWSISSAMSIAAFTLLWGAVAHLLGARGAIALAGILMLATPLLLTRRVLRLDIPVAGGTSREPVGARAPRSPNRQRR
ncbi:MFS transporter [Saccharopolyspora indica]|uniref:MFS transporter n=1 Tax=Saccharopolyspora indica TaxID=1229659 RepID=UPI0022EB1950|nr:MFS transporter [Saccharopolyspora indica]MDA3642515.1 MFS transporter [Saccharopolyspora indica]